MKKEVPAAVILLLLLALSLWNLLYLRKLTEEITTTLDESYAYSLAGDWEQALRRAKDMELQWEKAEWYTHIFIRYTSVEYASEAFYGYLTELYRRDIGGVSGSYSKLNTYIHNLYEAEKVTLKSFF